MSARGFTLIEVMAASTIAAVVASGTMMAFVAAARMSRIHNSGALAEASDFAQETLEGLYNHIATDDTKLADESVAVPPWHDDPLPPVPAPGTNSESILWLTPTSRRYRVTSEDCDGVGGVGDCYAVTVRVCWNDPLC